MDEARRADHAASTAARARLRAGKPLARLGERIGPDGAAQEDGFMRDVMRSDSRLRGTPSEALDFSSPELMQQIVHGVAEAERSGKWVRGFQEAAADLKEMTLADMIYWVYKTTRPVTRIEAGAENLLMQGAIEKLPAGFEKQTSLTLGAGGDLLQADGLELSRDILFENVADLLFEQDISLANLESPVTRGELVKEVIGDKAPPIECCNHAQFQILTSHRGKYLTVLNTSNNHIFDRGLEGLDTTLEALAESGILDIGTNRRAAEYGQGKTLTVNGIQLGFAAATFSLNGHPVPAEESHRIHVSSLLPRNGNPDLALLKQQIDDCKRQGCDFIIASLHWGFEFEMFPRKKQIEAARELIEAGADAIFSHHPHVIQPVEYYQPQRDSNRIAPIAYSLGSLTWGFTAPQLVLSLIQNLTLTKGCLNGVDVTYVEKSTVTPVFRSAIDRDGQTETRLEKLSDHVDGRSTRHPQDYIAAIQRYANLVLGPWHPLQPAVRPR
jgi:poly-gamma-glutamate capsule biosynthesis protein CapA/YwtB (metallophosphatase superfamily)